MEQGPIQKVRIAVVDDHPMVRAGIVRLLERWPVPHEVLEAENGLDYEERCREVGHVHLALVDLRMPVRDGYDTLVWMGKHQPRTRGVALSFETPPAVVRKALGCGACAVLEKTVEAEELFRALNCVLQSGYYVNAAVGADMRRAKVAEVNDVAGRWSCLTAREKEVALCYTQPNHDMAKVSKCLDIAEHTVETHLRHVYKKLDIHTKEELLRLVLSHKLP